MEWLEGQSLDQWMSTARPNPQAVLAALVGVGAALDYAHGVVHRDIKPANILVDPGRGAVLTDFGIARLLSDAIQTTSGTVGTPTYMAPEQISGQPATPATDIYALGITLYEILAGRVPFQGDTPAAVTYQHISVPPPDPRLYNPALPANAAKLLMQALAKDPKQRPVSAEDLIGELVTSLAAGSRSPTSASQTTQQSLLRGLPVAAFFTGILSIFVLVWLILRGSAPLPIQVSTPTFAPMSTLTAAGIPSPVMTTSTSSSTLTPSPAPTRTGTPTVTDVPTVTATPQPMFTAKNIANVRSGPGVNHPVIGQLHQGQQFEITGRNEAGDWWQFTYDNRAAWVLGRLVHANIAMGQVPVALNIPSPPPTMTPPAITDRVKVPAGRFLMGQQGVDPDEQPAHWVDLEAFWIDITEVTRGQYNRCVNADRCSPAHCDQRGDTELLVTCVTWEQANAFCQWVEGRLPTEAEWEKAARGEDGRVYPWGNQSPTRDLAVMEGCGGPLPVGSKPRGASPYGVLDMAGNVWEWTADWYDKNYYASSNDYNPRGPDQGWQKVLRSGRWWDGASEMRAADRNYYLPSDAHETIGFRCAWDAVP